MAQMSKQEKKDWKKRIKALTPEQYKSMLDENKSLKGQVSSLKTELAGVDQVIADKDDQISQYQGQMDDLRNEVASAKAEAAKAKTQPVQQPVARGGAINDQVGIVFKVQIGAFRNKDLSKFLDAGENFTGETGENGMKRYSLGVFTDYWEADTFKKYLREMGVKDAWIVSFKDGQRVPIKDVLENVSKS
ncbi:MAG: Ezrin/radixin/moesin family protein [Cyclobacteriaceae bacterium]